MSTKKKLLIEDGIQCNIANLPPLSLLSTSSVEHPEGEAIKQHLECPEEGPFEDVDVDDEDYNPSLDPEDEDETEEIKPEG